MSSTVAKATDVDSEPEINWEAIFDELGNEPYEPAGSSQLALMVSLHADGVSDEHAASEKMLEAVEEGYLEKNSNGYYIAGATPPEPEVEPDQDTDTGTKTVDGDETDEPAEAQPEPNNAELEDAHDHISGELQEMQKKIESMHQAVNVQMPMMTTAMRNLFGDIAFEDMPEAATKLRQTLEEHEDALREFQAQMDEMGDLSDGEATSTKARVMKLRRHLVEQAEEDGQQFTGKYGMTDKEIAAFFQHDISRSWASQLLDKVADGVGDEVDAHPAFTKKTFSDKRPKQVRVNLDKMSEDSFYRLKNSGESRED